MAAKNRLRRDNFIRILESLWYNPGRSRADLARELRLDRSTVGVLIDSLIESSLITQKQVVSTGPKGGRPPVLLRILPRVAYSIGIDLTYPVTKIAAGDLCGTFLGERSVHISSYGPETIIKLAEAIDLFRKELDPLFLNGPGLITVGVGVSGQVDASGEAIVLSHALHIHETLLVTLPLKERLQVPITLLNDAQSVVLREAWIRQKKDLLQIIVEIRPGGAEEDFGVGVGLVMDNQLIHGKAITHLLRPHHSEVRDAFVKDLGRSLALVANITGINEIVMGGDMEDILEPLENSLIYFTHGTPSSILVTRASGGKNAVALGAAFASMKYLFSSLAFPVTETLS